MEVFDTTTLIIIAAAVFVLLKLRSVLGQRTGYQRPSDLQDHINKRTKEAESSSADNIVKLPNRGNRQGEEEINPALEEINKLAKPRTKLNRGLKDVLEADPAFIPSQFVSGAEMAYEMIVNAFAEGDRKTLKNLLSPEVYGSFDSVISDREKRNETVRSTFVGIDDSKIVEADVKDKNSNLTVRFVSQIISSTHDNDGKLIEGDESDIATVTDIWTFSRDVRSNDPNWKLVATESEG